MLLKCLFNNLIALFQEENLSMVSFFFFGTLRPYLVLKKIEEKYKRKKIKEKKVEEKKF